MTKLSHRAWRIGLLALAGAVAWPARAELLLQQPPREVVFRLGTPNAGNVDLLLPFRDTAVDRLGPVRLYTSGPWGRWQHEPMLQLAWQRPEAADQGPVPELRLAGGASLSSSSDRFERTVASELRSDGDIRAELDIADLLLVRDRAWASRYSFNTSPTFDTTGFGLTSDGFGSMFRLPPEKPVVDWRCRRRPVLISRTGGESDRFELVRCDGSMAPEALDRLSILARSLDAARPAGLLPDEPDMVAWEKSHEWSTGVRVVHPRLVWALQQIADAFPNRAILLYSGYRPLADVNDASGHKSLHASGRALDLSVHRVENDELIKVCGKLRGIGCGYYPHNKFIHVDVRRGEAGDAAWVDSSLPGEPAKYETDYPGIMEHGRLVKPAKN